MRYFILSICLVAAFVLGAAGESFAMERMDWGGEKSITRHGHHGGWGRRGGRGWHRRGGGYGGGYYCY